MPVFTSRRKKRFKKLTIEMVMLKFLTWNNQIDAVGAVRIESSLYPFPSPVILNPVYALMSRTKGVWSLKPPFPLTSTMKIWSPWTPRQNISIQKQILHFEVDQPTSTSMLILLLSTGVLYLQGDAWWLALFDISIWHIDCRYIDTFEKYRYRYRYR